MNIRTIKRSTKESIRKPYRSSAATYTDYKEEIPDSEYYGRKHSEFKKPWLPASGYDEMEYKWDFPLEYLNPIHVDFETPDMGKYNFPGAQPVNPNWNPPNWNPPNWNPQYPVPDFPPPKEYAKKKPTGDGTQISWSYCVGKDFTFCPGDIVAVEFVEYTTDPIESVDAGEGRVIPASSYKLGESKHRSGYPEGTFTVMIRIPEIIGTEMEVVATTRSGERCISRGTRRSSCSSCDGVSIGYTTTQMTAGTSQALTVIDPYPFVEYEWSLSGGGSLSEQRGFSTTYAAPATNPNCSNNAVITLKDYNTGTVCATLSIAVNAYIDPNPSAPRTAFREANNDYHESYRCTQISWPDCTEIECTVDVQAVPGYAASYSTTFTEYACDGSPILVDAWERVGCPPTIQSGKTHKRTCTGTSGGCCGSLCQSCGDVEAEFLAREEETQTSCIAARGPWGDLRSQAMKEAGCCPSQLL